MNNIFFGGEVIKIECDNWVYIKNDKIKYSIVKINNDYFIENFKTKKKWKQKFVSFDETVNALYKKLLQVNSAWNTKHENNSYVVWNKGKSAKTNKKIRDGGRKGSKTKCELYNAGILSPWNKGLSKENNDVLLKMSNDRMGKNNPIHKFLNDENKVKEWKKKLSKALIGKNVGTLTDRFGVKKSKRIKTKQSESALIRKIHGHTGKKHSEESKAKMRMATAKRISEGKFPQTDTLPMREFEKILKELAVNGMFTKEFFCKYYSIDFAIVSKRLAFEVDGDFWHSNPKKYKNGPIYKSQKRNARVQKAKETYLKNRDWQIFRFWEDDILNNREEVKIRVKDIITEYVWNL